MSFAETLDDLGSGADAADAVEAWRGAPTAISMAASGNRFISSSPSDYPPAPSWHKGSGTVESSGPSAEDKVGDVHALMRLPHETFMAANGPLETFRYGTAGLAFADMETSQAFFEDEGDGISFDDTAVGWAVGLGVEHALSEKISVKAEGLYTRFEEQTDTTEDGSGYAAQPRRSGASTE
jgi:hypothetical protein